LRRKQSNGWCRLTEQKRTINDNHLTKIVRNLVNRLSCVNLLSHCIVRLTPLTPSYRMVSLPSALASRGRPVAHFLPSDPWDPAHTPASTARIAIVYLRVSPSVRDRPWRLSPPETHPFPSKSTKKGVWCGASGSTILPRRAHTTEYSQVRP
jgi:hypothetical protein